MFEYVWCRPDERRWREWHSFARRALHDVATRPFDMVSQMNSTEIEFTRRTQSPGTVPIVSSAVPVLASGVLSGLILLKNLWSFFQAPSGARSF